MKFWYDDVITLRITNILPYDPYDVICDVVNFQKQQPQEFYRKGILDLTQWWARAITKRGEFEEDKRCIREMFFFHLMYNNLL